MEIIMITPARFAIVFIMIVWNLLCADSAHAEINGYFSSPSITQGGVVDLHTSTDAASYTVRIYRFDGAYALVQEQKSLRGAQYPIPNQAWMNGAQWPTALSLRIPTDWPSAIYRVQLLTEPYDAACLHVANYGGAASPHCITLTLTVKPANPGGQAKNPNIRQCSNTRGLQRLGRWFALCARRLRRVAAAPEQL